MKFCPQCGTTFEPEARFCLECGFDKSSVEPVEPSPSSAPIVTETVAPPIVPQEVSEPDQTNICPQCNKTLAEGDRFCQECGFDTTTIVAIEPEVIKEAEPIEPKEIYTPQIAVPEPDALQGQSQFCPNCGTRFAIEDRFCPECGFDTSAETIKPVTPIPTVSTTPPPQEPKQSPAPVYTPPVRHPDPVAPQKSNKTWLWVLLTVLGLGAIGAGGWLGYTKYFSKTEEIAVDTLTSTIIPETPVIDTSMVQTEIAAQPKVTQTEQLKTSSKPLSRVDQELAKQKKKEPSKPAQQPQAQTEKQNLGVKVSSDPAMNDNMAKVLLEVGRKEDPKSKNPKNPTKLMIQKPTMIVRITTDHYNNGMGTSGGGSISIKDRDGGIIGSYKASGKTGTSGVPNAKWVAQPRIILQKGTYFIWDSDMSTWSKNFVGTGFVVVEGYEIN